MTESPKTADVDPVAALTVDFAQTAQALFSAGSVDDTLAQVLALGAASIEGCDFAGIFVVDHGVITTPAHTDPVVAELDALKHRSGEGPCLDALNRSSTFYAGDLTDNPRWPSFGPDATTRGVRSLLALPPRRRRNPRGPQPLHTPPHAFGVIDRGRGLLLAGSSCSAWRWPTRRSAPPARSSGRPGHSSRGGHGLRHHHGPSGQRGWRIVGPHARSPRRTILVTRSDGTLFGLLTAEQTQSSRARGERSTPR